MQRGPNTLYNLLMYNIDYINDTINFSQINCHTFRILLRFSLSLTLITGLTPPRETTKFAFLCKVWIGRDIINTIYSILIVWKSSFSFHVCLKLFSSSFSTLQNYRRTIWKAQTCSVDLSFSTSIRFLFFRREIIE